MSFTYIVIIHFTAACEDYVQFQIQILNFLAFLNCATYVMNIYVRNMLLCLIRFALPGIQAAFCFLVHSRNTTDHSLGIRSFTRSCQETLLTVICECFSNSV